MKKVGGLIAALALFAASGVLYLHRTKTVSDFDFVAHSRSAAALYRKGAVREAQSVYEQALSAAQARRNQREQAKALWGIANCLLLRFEYSASIARYLQAQQIAIRLQDREMVGLIRVGLGEAYQHLGDLRAADDSIRSAIQVLPEDSPQIAYPLKSLAVAEFVNGAKESSDYHFRQAIAAAQLSGDDSLLQNIYNQYASVLIRQQEYDLAEQMLADAFRLNVVRKLPYRPTTLLNLGVLALSRGRPNEARTYLTNAIETGKRGARVFSEYHAYYRRAMAEMELGRIPEALADFESARQQSRSWRRSISRGDLRSGASDLWLNHIYDGYLHAAMKLYRQSRSTDLLVRMFGLAEENRLANFQAQLMGERAFPAEYWSLVEKLRSAELAFFRDPTDLNREIRNRLEQELVQRENLGISSSAHTDIRDDLVPPSGITLGQNRVEKTENFAAVSALYRYRSVISGSDLYLSFHVGDRESYLWLLTAKNLVVLPLPPRSELQSRILEFRKALEQDRPEFPEVSSDLYKTLFGAMPPEMAALPNWILSLDGPLFDVPFAALRFPLPQGESRFLIERNSLRIVPGISFLGPARVRPGLGRFVGIGDPIYNTADSRRPADWLRFVKSLFPTAEASSEPALTRLPASGREIQKAAKAWAASQPPLLLTGSEITRGRVEQILSEHPAVLHLATHVLQPMAQRELAIIAIGLDARGQPDYLTPNEIAAHDYRPGLVVLSGCSSGQGKALAGVGLFGLTRAWLLSGAQAVIASYWPTSDEPGALFERLYSSYPVATNTLSAAGSSTALRVAQLAMLRSGSWRSRPRYWASFYVMGKD